MSARALWPLLLVLPLSACKGGAINFGDDTGGGASGDDTGEWVGADPDSRLIANMVTWPCSGGDRGSYEGAYSLEVSLEYAPNGVSSMELPPVGECDGGLSMFPLDAGSEGADPDGVSEPSYYILTGDSNELSGVMSRRAPGFYVGDVLGNQHSCTPMETFIANGVGITDAGVLTDVVTPPSGALFTVDTFDADSGAELSGGLEFGQNLSLEWDYEDFDTIWIQVRMEREGLAYDYVTCNATGLSGFDVNQTVWDYLNEDIPVELINLYIGFENADVQETSSGLKANVFTRAIHVETLSN